MNERKTPSANTDKRRSAREEMLLRGPIPKVTLKMAIPTIVAFLITSIYNLADTYFVSSLGTNATAAVSVNQSLDHIIMMAGSLLAIGANSYISRLLGAKRKEHASHVLSTAWFMAAAFGALVLTLGTLFLHPMVRLLGATPTCEEYAIQYATYVLLVAPFMATSFVMNQCLRAEGSAMLSMVGMGFGGILNCYLDPLFIFKFGLGVTGASMATAISKLVSFGILIYPYLSHHSLLRIKAGLIRFEKDIFVQIFSVGSSSLLRNALSVLAAITLNQAAGSISDSVLAGIGVSNRIMMFPFGIILGFGAGYQPVAGFNWGARRFDRVRGSYSFAWKFSVFGSILMGALLWIFAVPLIHLFSAVDPEMQRIGALCIRLQCLALPAHAWVAMVNMLCASLGFAGWAAILATARQGYCLLPFILPAAFFFGGKGLCSVQALADLLSLIPAAIILRRAFRRIRQEEEKHLAMP